MDNIAVVLMGVSFGALGGDLAMEAADAMDLGMMSSALIFMGGAGIGTLAGIHADSLMFEWNESDNYSDESSHSN